MVIAPTLWSIAGVVTRHLSPELQANGRFEITPQSIRLRKRYLKEHERKRAQREAA